ncbi:MAG: hypothetical protein KKB13_17715 [Chloroflexi bacterium]|nr:hypothetical protein [Chloroflexota bacterium]
MNDNGAVRIGLLGQWADYVNKAALNGTITGTPIHIDYFRRIPGPRVGVLEIAAGLASGKLVRALARDNAALLRQFVPYAFVGEPQAFMSGRFVRVEAGWPGDLAETMIRLGDLNRHPHTDGRWVAGKNEHGVTVVPGLHDQTPHWLVSGATGSGKSVALRSAVLQLSQDSANALVLVDGKFGEGLGDLARLPGVVGPVAVDAATTQSALGWACVQMRERYTTPGQHGRVVVIFDEFQELATDAVVMNLLRKLAAQGRAAGVHLIAATQHPTVDAFGDATTRRNLVGKIALRVADPDASRVAVGGRLPRADCLLGAGDAYTVGPGTCHRVQMAYVGPEDIAQAESGMWRFDAWPEYDASEIGQNLPVDSTNGAKSWTPSEVGVALIAAAEGEGRPAMMTRMQTEGLRGMGDHRAAQLVKFGKQALAWLQDCDYDVCYVGN